MWSEFRFNGERKMEIEIASIMHRSLLVGIGLIGGLILRSYVPDWPSRWINRFCRMAESVLPGRRLRCIENRIDSLTECSTRMNSDIDDIKRLLVRLLDANNKKAATPLKNGIATHQ
jgi:hypothetical protein